MRGVLSTIRLTKLYHMEDRLPKLRHNYTQVS